MLFSPLGFLHYLQWTVWYEPIVMAHAPILYEYQKYRLVLDISAKTPRFEGMLTSFSSLSCLTLLASPCHTESKILQVAVAEWQQECPCSLHRANLAQKTIINIIHSVWFIECWIKPPVELQQNSSGWDLAFEDWPPVPVSLNKYIPISRINNNAKTHSSPNPDLVIKTPKYFLFNIIYKHRT